MDERTFLDDVLDFGVAHVAEDRSAIVVILGVDGKHYVGSRPQRRETAFSVATRVGNREGTHAAYVVYRVGKQVVLYAGKNTVLRHREVTA